MFNFIKKLFGFGSDDDGVSSSLIERATNSALMSENNFAPTDLTSEGLTQFFHDNEELEQLQQQQLLHDYLHQQQIYDQQQHDLEQLQHIQNMHDPYLNPGQDIVVDETYHGHDHGFDDHF